MKKIYNISRNTCGVYLITNKINHKKYVGSSVNISARLSTHFGRDTKKYTHSNFYQDICKYGRENFEFKVLEECVRNELIEKEQYYFDLIKPEYNIVRPSKCNFDNPIIRQKAWDVCRSEQFRKKKSEQYKQPHYRELFSKIQDKRKKQVLMFKEGKFIKEFQSFMDCQKWLNENTDFKGKNKISKIKSVCDKERQTAYGYYFEYKKTSND